VLAAGHGTRMKSQIPKHLHKVAGVPIVERVIRAGLAIEPCQLVAVVSPNLADLPARLSMDGAFTTAVQVNPEGTAVAVRCALDHIGPVEHIVSLLGDSPLLTGDVVRELVEGARTSGAKVTILTCVVPRAESYGRIERDDDGNIRRIVELKNDDPSKRTGETEINSGIMVLDAAWARSALEAVQLSPLAGEFLLTDIVEVAIGEHVDGAPWPVSAVTAPHDIALGINDRVQQGEADRLIRERVRRSLQSSGVTIIGPETVFIDETVRVGKDTTILPFSVITGDTVIGSCCEIGPHAVLENAVIGDRVTLRSSTVTDSSIDHDARVGPYAHLRGNTRIGPHAHIGTSTELKNSQVGERSNVGHFGYLGDTTLGPNSNIGAGTVTANYDGTNKHPTSIGSNVFIGSDTVMVAPVAIGDGAKSGAGAVITRDVPAGTTVVGVPAKPHTKSRGDDDTTGE
jgi:bifunctional UDP-N-acetylglucosamine pyrophosphorylase / glucosamine-1-phosphate N-acetyltransferase